ncbi:hypothetical protein BB559_002726 [Furculomyces boomerangus]|uniref:Uncharacterized protein n=1 Tax=Furculomyces boomerangus TaxID=61424 RepID=A0A2T9YSU8_9FUNG|nr:hypothetical protein BB559_002726 [Furculomyces boomerangus]
MFESPNEIIKTINENHFKANSDWFKGFSSQSNFENTEISQESSESGDANDDSNYCYYMSGKDPVYESDKDRMYSANDVE